MAYCTGKLIVCESAYFVPKCDVVELSNHSFRFLHQVGCASCDDGKFAVIAFLSGGAEVDLLNKEELIACV